MESSIATFLARQVGCEILPAHLYPSNFVSTRSVCFRVPVLTDDPRKGIQKKWKTKPSPGGTAIVWRLL